MLDMKDMDVWRMTGVAVSIFVRALAVPVIRYGHVPCPYGRGDPDACPRAARSGRWTARTPIIISVARPATSLP